MKANEKIGWLIRAARVELNLTQEQVANELFMSQAYYRNIEKGRVNPTVNVVEKIIRYFIKEREKQLQEEHRNDQRRTEIDQLEVSGCGRNA